MKRGKGGVLLNTLRIFSVLLDGKSHTTDAFVFLGLHPKTITRTLHLLTQIPEFKIFIRKYEGKLYFRSEYKFQHTPAQYKFKKCSGCQKKKPVEEFSFFRGSSDGRKAYCKLCDRQVNKDNYLKNNIFKKEYEKMRYKRDREKRLKLAKTIHQKKKLKLLSNSSSS